MSFVKVLYLNLLPECVKTRTFRVILQNFSGHATDHPLKTLPSALSINLIFDVTAARSFGPPSETFYVRHWVQILILIENFVLF